jgi:hypothetical protein
MRKSAIKRMQLAKLAVPVTIVFALTAQYAAAQGCAMCYQNAAAAGSNAQAGLRHGILILLIPALALFTGILSLLYQRRDP